jgi:tRNA A37 threonylcarbamoyladenosine dehydratase
MQRIVGSFVVVVGLGGVGSHAAHLLLRSGVGRLLLVDFDQVCFTIHFQFNKVQIMSIS